MVDWTFLVPPVVEKRLLTLSLLNVAVGIGCGTVFVFGGLYSLYRGSRDLSIFGGASVFYGYAALMCGWWRLLKKYYRPPPSDERSASGV